MLNVESLNMGISRVVNIADLRLLAKRRLPRVVFDYIDGGADGEVTLRENCRIFDSVEFRARNAVAGPPPDLRTRILGTDFALPFLLAPIGSSRLFFPRGETVAAQRGRYRGNRLYSINTFGKPARGRAGRLERAGLVPAVSCRRQRCRYSCDRTSAGSRILRSCRHDRYAGCRIARA